MTLDMFRMTWPAGLQATRGAEMRHRSLALRTRTMLTSSAQCLTRWVAERDITSNLRGRGKEKIQS